MSSGGDRSAGRPAKPVTLYVVPTPIGNLEDITLRAIRVLREVPLILAEDTRHTRKLLNHYGIETPLLSYHQHNKVMRLDRVLSLLQQSDVALVSDSGMPSISDPGFELVVAARSAGIAVDVLPGPNAVITAVVSAALPGPGFLFGGFLPRRAGERRAYLQSVDSLPYTLVFYEAPHRLLATLRDIKLTLGDRTVVVCRELTKLHAETVRGSAAGLLQRFETQPPKGEITLLIQGVAAMSQSVDSEGALVELRRLAHTGLDRRAAVAQVM